MNKKLQLSESELKNIVLRSVKKILSEENIWQKANRSMNNAAQWVSDKVDDFHAGAPTKEGNPTSICDVIEGNKWRIMGTVANKQYIPAKNGLNFVNGSNNIVITPVLGTYFEKHGLSIDELIEDINIFLDGRGHASHYKSLGRDRELININAPMNLFNCASVNESVYGNDGFTSSSSMDAGSNYTTTNTGDVKSPEQQERGKARDNEFEATIAKYLKTRGRYSRDGEYYLYGDFDLGLKTEINGTYVKLLYTKQDTNEVTCFLSQKTGDYGWKTTRYTELPTEMKIEIVDKIGRYTGKNKLV
jgi:hypothetical protein